MFSNDVQVQISLVRISICVMAVRQKFKRHLFEFQDVIEQSKNTIHFIRLHAPWPLLCRYAEELNLRAPIQVSPETTIAVFEVKFTS